MTAKPTLLALSGSLRTGSYNTLILKHLAEVIQDQAQLTVFALNEIPLYDQDLDVDAPPAAVAALRQAIAAADGVVIATPEYNYGMSGVLKNALDWASRPYAASALIGKPVLTMASSPAVTGGVRALAGLHESLLGIGAQLVARPQTVIGSVHQRVVDGKISDAATLTFLRDGINDLLRDIRGKALALKAA